MKTLIIAEKPSVAAEIAAALGVPKSKNIYENDELIISNCFGHLLKISVPEWKDKNRPLPVIPNFFPVEPIAGKEAQCDLLANLMNRADVSTIANACDADREGESIFRRIFDYVGCKKPVKRMWIQSTTKQGYIQAFQNMKDGVEFHHLYDAAQSRSEADWLLGMNGSRVLDCQVGRVMLPTLAMVVDAYLANKNFKSSDYWEIGAEFKVQSGSYEARLLENGKIAKFDSKEAAQAALKLAQSHSFFSVEDESKTSLVNAPYLFDAAELQKVANKKFKYGADKTLSIMQSLYEKYKVMTYPRSDYNALPEDYLETISTTINHLSSLNEYQWIVSNMEQNNLITQNKRVFDNSRIDSHFAIVPTGFIKNGAGKEIPISELDEAELKSILSTEEYNVFNLIVLRTLAAFYPAAEYAITTRMTQSGDSIFKSTGKVLMKQGWLFVYGGVEEVDDKATEEKAINLPKIEVGELAKVDKLAIHDLKTTAPPLMTESSLLQAMQTAGRNIEDKELSNLMKEIKGIGTSATRSEIIEKLKTVGKEQPYISIEKNRLIPSEEAIHLIKHIRNIYPQIANPIITAEWEFQLLKVQNGEQSRNDFMNEIKSFVKECIHSLQEHSLQVAETLCLCPSCQKGELKGRRFDWFCENCSFCLKKQIAKRVMKKDELLQLATQGKTDILKGFVNKNEQTFSCALKLVLKEESGQLETIFDFEPAKKYTCPCCKQHDLVTRSKSLNCECGFVLWKTVGEKILSEKVIETLITKGKTGKISGFKGKSGKEFTSELIIDYENKRVVYGFVK